MTCQSTQNGPIGVTVGRRAARGRENEVTKLGPKWLQVLLICSLSITEASPTLGC